MISPAFITEWSQQCPWISPAQIEQDLVLSRGLVEIYSDPILRERLLFRGGTALHKIVLKPAVADAFAHYMQAENHPVSSAEFALNLAAKMKHAGFLSDTPPILRPGIQYNSTEAFDWIQANLISRLP